MAIVAGTLFIVATVFFAGFFMGGTAGITGTAKGMGVGEATTACRAASVGRE